MHLKSLLLASSASLFAIVGIAAAQAADLTAAEAVEAAPAPASAGSVGICDVAGVGYFYIPGGQTCLKIGGAVEATGGYASIGGGSVYKDGYAKVEARMDIDTQTESELGPIGTKFRLSLNHGFLGGLDVANSSSTDAGVELAYITVGPAFVGYKETLFNTKFGYGDTFDVENYFGGHLNSLTAGAMVDNIGGGFYVGGAVEGSQRGQWIASYDESNDVDFVGRAGIAGQSWGSSDLSVIYSKSNDLWGVKSTTDVDVMEGTQARVTLAYFDLANDDAILLGLGAKHAFTEQVSAFAGGGYVINDALDNPYIANAGVVYTPIKDFDVTGEVGYAKAGGADNYNTTLKFTRSF